MAGTRGKPPAFQLYADDWLMGTIDMTLAERGAYITLIAYQWDHGGIPGDDEKALARILGCSVGECRRVWPRVARKFTLRLEHGWANQRLETEREKQEEYRRKQAANGKAGGRPRKPTANPSLSDLESGGLAKPFEKQNPNESGGLAKPFEKQNPNESQAVGKTKPKKSSPSPSPSPSSSVPSERVPARAKPTPIVARRNLSAAWEGPRGIYVPQRQHERFVALRNGNESELWDWYADVAEAFAYGARKGEEPGANMFKFWDARYEERWPAAGVKPKDTGPVYIKAHEHPEYAYLWKREPGQA